MSAIYRKDPESGTYEPIVQPLYRRPIWPQILVALLAAFVVYADSPRSTTSSVHHWPTTAKSFDAHAAPSSLRGAMELYQTRGGKYIYGHNDCSTFVLDYLAGHGIRLAERQTTATLIDPTVAAKMHLTPMTEVDLNMPIPQSVVVMRYVGARRQTVGHCAVRVVQDGDVFFVHNTERQGLVCESEKNFYARFNDRMIKDLHYYRFQPGF